MRVNRGWSFGIICFRLGGCFLCLNPSSLAATTFPSQSLLQNGTNLIEIQAPVNSSAQTLASWVQWLRDHDKDAEAIATAGRRLMQEHLTADKIKE